MNSDHRVCLAIVADRLTYWEDDRRMPHGENRACHRVKHISIAEEAVSLPLS